MLIHLKTQLLAIFRLIYFYFGLNRKIVKA